MRIIRKHGTVYVEKISGYGWYLHCIIVDQEHRSTGIGTQMMKQVLEKCGRPIYLYVSSEYGGDIKRLREFYSRFGFEEYKGDIIGYNYNMALGL